MQPHESLEIIEDADEIDDEEELDNIKIYEHSPMAKQGSNTNPQGVDGK